jgi:hypothetical protein
MVSPATLISSNETSTSAAAPAATPIPDPSTLAFHLAAVSTSSWTPDDGVRYEDRLISRAALSRWIGISEPRLRVWQRLGIGPEPLRPGGVRVMYRIGSVLEFLKGRSALGCPDLRQQVRLLSSKIKQQKAENLSAN